MVTGDPTRIHAICRGDALAAHAVIGELFQMIFAKITRCTPVHFEALEAEASAKEAHALVLFWKGWWVYRKVCQVCGLILQSCPH